MGTLKTQNGHQGTPKWQKVFGRSHQHSLNKFIDPRIHSMQKGCDGEKEKKKTEKRRKEW